MNKVYLVISEWALNGEEFGSDAIVCTTYEGAKKQFNEIKESMRLGYACDIDGLCPIFDEDENIIEDEDKDYYSIYPEGRWSEDHDCVRIKETTLLE